MTGTLTRYEAHGSVVLVIVEDAAELRTVPMDARSWSHVLDARGGIANVIGQAVEVRGAGAAASLAFLDEEDGAP